jgi:hypothetical protein
MTTPPDYVTALEAAYGPPSQAGFGSAVFYEELEAEADLEKAALAKYRFFIGPLWERFGEAVWLTPWQAVYTRPPDAERDIVVELRAIPDRAAALSASMLLENGDEATTPLAVAYDDPAVTDLVVYSVGDGAAMSGILIAGRRRASGTDTDEAVFLILLLD